MALGLGPHSPSCYTVGLISAYIVAIPLLALLARYLIIAKQQRNLPTGYAPHDAPGPRQPLLQHERGTEGTAVLPLQPPQKLEEELYPPVERALRRWYFAQVWEAY